MTPRSPLKELLAPSHGEAPVHAIVRALSGGGGMSATRLSQVTGLAKSTISMALAELRLSGIVVDAAPAERTNAPGRPATAVQLNPAAGTCIGVHLELAGLRVCLADVSHAVLDEHFVPLPQDYAPEDGLTAAAGCIATLFKDNGLPRAHLLGAGVSVSGPVTPAGVIHRASILPAWTGINIRELFSQVLRTPVYADNESNCAAIAEHMWGAAQGHDNFVMFKIDTGVGGAVFCNGRVIAGVSGGAGEFGHMSIDAGGRLCRCGNRGCLELSASLREPMQQLSAVLGRPVDADEVIAMAGNGDIGALRLLNDCGAAAGRGLATIAAVLNPPLVLVGGRAALAGDALLGPLRTEFEKHCLIKPSELSPPERTEIRAGKFTHNDSLLGAVGLVLRAMASGEVQSG